MPVKNTTKAKLKTGQVVYGTFVRYPDATLAETLAYHDWDFLLFDGEHGVIEPRDCENLARAAELHGVTPVVRVAANQPHIILRMMDTGVHGCQIPWVNSAEEAERAVQAVKYFPRGKRGLAGVTRAASQGHAVLTQYVQTANAETLVIVQVETMTAVENLDAMLQVPDIDVFFVGPNDLAHSIGLPGQVPDVRVQSTIEEIFNKVIAAGKTPGIQVQNAEAAKLWRSKGAKYITVQLESLIRPALEGYLKAVRE
jgi:4-hydroxy-2-oxoheptanedioate aldolase